jgi:ABC-type phosphate/phosphonate transport system substrate-binding protein
MERCTIMIANARMYAVTPEAEAAWQSLLAHIAADADVALDYLAYPAPLPLEDLWRRGDLGCVLMCGYPIALGIADVVPIAAPIPSASWAEGRAVYRSDLIVRTDAPFASLEDTFGGRTGWTVEHSHSGFNAWRHHLLAYRSDKRPALYGEVRGNLITARRILDEVLAGTIDVGPLDAYWHMLIRQYRHELLAGARVLASTAVAPMPAFVASRGVDSEVIAGLRSAFAAAASRPWFAGASRALMIDGFAPVDHASFAETLRWDAEARAAGYPVPA